MRLDSRALTPDALEEAALHYARQGYVELAGLEASVTPMFRSILARLLEMNATEFSALLEAVPVTTLFSSEMRKRLSRIETPPGLGSALIDSLGPLVARLIGPLVHVSRDFHAQFKGGNVPGIETYHHELASEYLEVHGAYLLHQDFTGAGIPTSPSGLTLWVALNDCPESTLRVFPGSHRLGLLCNRMWGLDDPRLAHLAAPVDIPARSGTGVLFNALLVHGTGHPGTLRRVSCDIRFFPLCGFLGSTVHRLHPSPRKALGEARERDLDAVLKTPRLEDLAYLGRNVALDDPPALSPLHWVNYVDRRLRDDLAGARSSLDRLVNTDVSGEPATAFGSRWHSKPIDMAALHAVRSQILDAG